MHLKLASIFHLSQLVDIFSYETPLTLNNPNQSNLVTNSEIKTSVVVYNFHNIHSQNRFFFFITSVNNVGKNQPYSVNELYLNACWLEREVAEMHGFFFYGKKDLRNLLLPYGDTSSPMIKSFPSIGTREIFYDSPSNLITQNPVSLQF